MIPPFKENFQYSVCYLVNDVEIEIDFVFVVFRIKWDMDAKEII